MKIEAGHDLGNMTRGWRNMVMKIISGLGKKQAEKKEHRVQVPKPGRQLEGRGVTVFRADAVFKGSATKNGWGSRGFETTDVKVWELHWVRPTKSWVLENQMSAQPLKPGSPTHLARLVTL